LEIECRNQYLLLVGRFPDRGWAERADPARQEPETQHRGELSKKPEPRRIAENGEAAANLFNGSLFPPPP
jgi:hypothetical protein